MNPRTTLVLAVLAALVTGVAWEDARNTEIHFQKDLDQPNRFPDSAVTSMSIARPGIELRLTRDDRGWRLVAPVEYPASHVSTETIIRLVRELRVRGEGPTPAEAGIGTDAARLELGLRGGGSVSLAFGPPHPTLPYRYAALGDRVVLIDPAIADAIEAVTVDDLRSEAICDIPIPLAVSLAVERGNERYAVHRSGEEWVLEAPTGGDAEARVIRRAIEALNSWAVHSFVADAVTDERELAARGLSPPAGRIEVRERGTDRAVRLRLGAATDLPGGGGEGLYVYIESTKTVVRATAAILASLPATEALQSRLLVRIPEPDIALVRILGDYRRVDLARTEEGGWSLVWAGDETPHPADSALFERMLESLRGATVERFIPFDVGNLQEHGFDRPALAVELVRAGGERERLEVGAEIAAEPGLRAVRNPRWSGAAIAAVPDLERWLSAPFSLRSPHAVMLPREAIRRIRLVAPGGESRTFVRPHEEWRVSGSGASAPEVHPELRAALSALPDLLAGRWEASVPTPPGPRARSFAVELLPAEEGAAEPWLRLWVGPEDSTGRLIRIGDEGWVMRVPVPYPDDPFPALERALERP